LRLSPSTARAAPRSSRGGLWSSPPVYRPPPPKNGHHSPRPGSDGTGASLYLFGAGEHAVFKLEVTEWRRDSRVTTLDARLWPTVLPSYGISWESLCLSAIVQVAELLHMCGRRECVAQTCIAGPCDPDGSTPRRQQLPRTPARRTLTLSTRMTRTAQGPGSQPTAISSLGHALVPTFRPQPLLPQPTRTPSRRERKILALPLRPHPFPVTQL
jgi:hypothetical protein